MKTKPEKLDSDPISRPRCYFCEKYVPIIDRSYDERGRMIHADSRDCLSE